MKRLLIAIALVLAVGSVWGAEAFTGVQVGTWMVKGQPTEVAVELGSDVVLFSDPVKHFRTCAYTGFFRTTGTNELEGVTAMAIIEKYFQVASVEWYLRFGSGTLYQIKEGEDSPDFASQVELGGKVVGFFSVGAGAYWLPRTGPDGAFIYGSLNLLL